MVMTAHVICSQIDPDRPATLSSKILRGILRGQLRYTRLILSDDMEMKAIADHFGVDDAPRMAIEAGCDILLYRTEAATRHAYAALTKALDEGKLSPDLVLEAAGRNEALKREVLMPYYPASVAEVGTKVGTPENLALAQRFSPASP